MGAYQVTLQCKLRRGQPRPVLLKQNVVFEESTVGRLAAPWAIRRQAGGSRVMHQAFGCVDVSTGHF